MLFILSACIVSMIIRCQTMSCEGFNHHSCALSIFQIHYGRLPPAVSNVCCSGCGATINPQIDSLPIESPQTKVVIQPVLVNPRPFSTQTVCSRKLDFKQQLFTHQFEFHCFCQRIKSSYICRQI